MLAGKDTIKAIVLFLMENGANVNAQTKDGFTPVPLHLASMNGHDSVVLLLLKSDADINANDKDGWTPLHES
jgi:ankyrin repeat protein